MSDLSKWINDLAGDYVESWVGEQIAAAWEQDKATILKLNEQIERLTNREQELMVFIDSLKPLIGGPLQREARALIARQQGVRKSEDDI